MTESPENNLEADVVEMEIAESDFASVQATEVSQPNDEIAALSSLRSYTPEPGSASPSAGEQGAEPRTTAESSAADADLATELNEINSARLDPSSNEADPANWTAALPAQNLNSAGLGALGQSLQAVSTQLTTEVQTLTAQASQTAQMSNTMSQAASSVLANMLEEDEAASKE